MSADLVSRLVRIAVDRVNVLKKDAGEIIAAADAGQTAYGDMGNYMFLQSNYYLGFMYFFQHPENSLAGDPWCLQTAIRFSDFLPRLLDEAIAAGKKLPTAEWSPLGLVELLDLVKPEEPRRGQWLRFIEHYIARALAKPFGYTSPNHEAWRNVFLYRSGQVLDRPDLCDTAVFFCKQQIPYQTPEGFWEEGQHHGPSMTYNRLMLEPLAWLYRLSGDEEIGNATKRLADFMANWSFPDGCAVGAFDGRQSTSFGFGPPICPGLELTAAGRSLNARCLEQLTSPELNNASVRGSALYDHFSLFFYASSLRYHAQAVPQAERPIAADASAGLPTDKSGTRENHTATFDGVLARQGKWCVGLSSQNSDLPREATDIFRLERASRIEIWHADAHLCLGGGHNRKDWPVPYANAVLDTGYSGPTQFGFMDPEKFPEHRHYYLPKFCQAGSHSNVPTLDSHFAHGSIRFETHFLSDTSLRIDAHWRIRHVQRLCLQLPLVVWCGANCLADTAPISNRATTPAEVRGTVSALAGNFGQNVSLDIPRGVPTRVYFPLPTLKYYIDPKVPDTRPLLFSMALVSSQWTSPPETGAATWHLSVRPNR